jgi:ACS family hexuronate transporter-like MFS transporter
MTDGAGPMSNALASTGESEANAPMAFKMTGYRWRICALLFFANTINYMDRQVLSFLAPLLQTKIGWTEIQYGYIVVAFQAAYALGLLVMGGVIDRIGVKLGYALTIALWSLASMSHALARTAFALLPWSG